MINPDEVHLQLPTAILIGVACVIAILLLSQVILTIKKFFCALKKVAPALENITDHSFTRLNTSGYKSLDMLCDAINRLAARLTHENDELLFQKMQLENVLNSMIESVVALNARGEILQLNASAQRLFSLAEMFKGRLFSEVVRVSQLNDFIETLIHQPYPKELVLEMQYQPTVDATIAYWRVCGALVQNRSGKIVGATLVIEDVTQIRKFERSQRDFVANVSHEIRTPLTVIKSACESLIDGGLDDSDFTHKCIESMHRHTDRLACLVDDILALSKIENNLEFTSLKRELISIHNLLEHVVFMAQESANKKQTRITIDCDPNLEFSLNEPFMQQALLNLVLNAIKYSFPCKEIILEAKLLDFGVLQFVVRDQGHGIAPEHISRVFERFYRVDKARSRHEGGTGLGLAIVKHIVELHGGRVELNSRLGYGSDFMLILPEKNNKI